MGILRIEFDNPCGVTHTGEDLNGRVIITGQEGVKINYVGVNLRGIGISHWQNSDEIHFRGFENYFEKKMVLFGSELPGGAYYEFPDSGFGEQEFRFNFRIPEQCPSSYEGPPYSSSAHTRFTCDATLLFSTYFDENVKKNKSSNFTVIRHLDLNREPNLQELCAHTTKTGEADMTCCCCVSGKIQGSFKVEGHAFVPGELIPTVSEIVNNSNTSVECMLSIKQYVTLKAYDQSGNLGQKEKTTIVATEDLGTVDEQASVQYVRSIQVPSVPPSRLDGCDIIDIKYLIRLQGKSWCDLKLEQDIFIGTIPLRNRPVAITQQPPSTSILPPMSTTPLMPSAPGDLQMGPISHNDVDLDPPPDYCDVAPPSYEQCVHMSQASHPGGENTVTWAPHYPNWQNTTTTTLAIV